MNHSDETANHEYMGCRHEVLKKVPGLKDGYRGKEEILDLVSS